jgi:negative regulator of replication initiation
MPVLTRILLAYKEGSGKGNFAMPRMKQISIDVDVDKAIYANRLTLSESENDILRRMLLSPAHPSLPKRVAPIGIPRELKRRGKWSVHLLGDEHKAANMKDAYCILLGLLADLDSEFLEQFSVLGSSSRRYIAKNALSLFTKSAHLAKDHATSLNEEWFADTNVSRQQVGKRTRAAVAIAGLDYGIDVKITEAGRTI